MKKISRNKQKDTQPLAGLLELKQMLFIPILIVGLIFYTANFLVPSIL